MRLVQSAQMAQKAETWEREWADSNNSTECGWPHSMMKSGRDKKQQSGLGDEDKGEDSKHVEAEWEVPLRPSSRQFYKYERPELAAADTERLVLSKEGSVSAQSL